MTTTRGDSTDGGYDRFFREATGGLSPYNWQRKIATEGFTDIIPVPTGLGKTEGATLAWAWRRFVLEAEEPLHLVYCLPMRSLVQQTLSKMKENFSRLESARRLHTPVKIYQLMSGAIEAKWDEKPDEPWILVGTQDQLLSRALNRGYSMSRFRWSVHFGLLNQDCLWVVDETQLMGPGLWTTAQLDWMRRKRFTTIKPSRTIWMSATVGACFTETTDRKNDGLDRVTSLNPELDEDTNLELRRRCEAVRPVQWFAPLGGKHASGLYAQIATAAREAHKAGTLSLVICNTVEGAQRIFGALPEEPPKVLLTSRFRRSDRRRAEDELLRFESRRASRAAGRIPVSGGASIDAGLIAVSTQVVEAGLDISAHELWSELSPWPSVVQRLGRLNRDGRDETARAHFWKSADMKDDRSGGEGRLGPYLKSDIDIADVLLNALIAPSAGMPIGSAMKDVANAHEPLLRKALEPPLEPLPRAMDVHGLFSTERDLFGGFTDVSRFVRGSDPNADLTLFWRVWRGLAPPKGDELDGPAFDADEGCAVPFYRLREFLLARKSKAWTWNEDSGKWDACPPTDLRAGMLVMVHGDVGGYSRELGWTGDPKDTLGTMPRVGSGHALRDDDDTEVGYWATLRTHLNDTKLEASKLCEGVALSGSDGLTAQLREAVVQAAALHDLGKAHPKWQEALPAGLKGTLLAKCPHVLKVNATDDDPLILALVADLAPESVRLGDLPRSGGLMLRWALKKRLVRDALRQLRALPCVQYASHARLLPGLRHEAASALAMWQRYRESAPYPALAVYLAAAHHGKVRTVLRGLSEGGDVFGVARDTGALDVDGETWPLDFDVALDGSKGEWRVGTFVLEDNGWTGLVSDLLGPWRHDDHSDAGAVPAGEPRRLGPFNLAYLEALVRVADWRASGDPSSKLVPFEALAKGQRV